MKMNFEIRIGYLTLDHKIEGANLNIKDSEMSLGFEMEPSELKECLLTVRDTLKEIGVILPNGSTLGRRYYKKDRVEKHDPKTK